MSSFTKQPVIVPWDYSDMSKAALEKAIGFAESAGRKAANSCFRSSVTASRYSLPTTKKQA